MNIGQFALIKKDMRSVTSNKQVFTVLLIVPIVLTIALPSIFVFVISFAPDAASDFRKLLDMLPAPDGEYSQQQQIFSLILNQIMPSFFLISEEMDISLDGIVFHDRAPQAVAKCVVDYFAGKSEAESQRYIDLCMSADKLK